MTWQTLQHPGESIHCAACSILIFFYQSNPRLNLSSQGTPLYSGTTYSLWKTHFPSIWLLPSAAISISSLVGRGRCIKAYQLRSTWRHLWHIYWRMNCPARIALPQTATTRATWPGQNTWRSFGSTPTPCRLVRTWPSSRTCFLCIQAAKLNLLVFFFVPN